MIENTEVDVLMKCETCGYEELVPLKTLETIRNLPPVSDIDKILCPFCLNYMYRKDNNKQHNNNQ